MDGLYRSKDRYLVRSVCSNCKLHNAAIRVLSLGSGDIPVLSLAQTPPSCCLSPILVLLSPCSQEFVEKCQCCCAPQLQDPP